MAQSVAIANEFLKRRPFSQMQLQKLAFIANGFNLAINGERLVDETYKAWDLGPVETYLRDHISRWGSQNIPRLISERDRGSQWLFEKDKPTGEPYRARLSVDENAVVEQVFRRYGRLSAFKLSELTHLPDTPWYRAYQKGRNTDISDVDIIEHYTDLLRSSKATA
ncbi:Panacea domain-containing protein [Algimonas porphyrae]|uniref:Panacea domain-containing protein n=1 Tax=Algimonas porphyrae TaxID=1128113 RepID=UPI00352A3070